MNEIHPKDCILYWIVIRNRFPADHRGEGGPESRARVLPDAGFSNRDIHQTSEVVRISVFQRVHRVQIVLTCLMATAYYRSHECSGHQRIGFFVEHVPWQVMAGDQVMSTYRPQ